MVAGAGIGKVPWEPVPVPCPSVTGRILMPSTASVWRAVQAPTISAIASSAPTSWKWTMGPVHFLLGRIDPLKDPAGHRKRRCRDMRSGLIEPLQHFVKRPVGRCCSGVDLERTGSRPG